MTMIDWRIQGVEVATCNCDWGCPCQFNALPSHGNCRAATAIHVNKGHFGGTPLDGINFAGLFAWPKAIHEGHGEALPIVDERATPDQRNAVLTIMSGQHSEPGANLFSVFSTTLEKFHEPQFRKIDFELDLQRGSGRFSVANLVEAHAEPIRNPVTGAEHRVSLKVPQGFEFNEAEFLSGRVQTRNAPIDLQWERSHAHACKLDMTGRGVVRP